MKVQAEKSGLTAYDVGNVIALIVLWLGVSGLAGWRYGVGWGVSASLLGLLVLSVVTGIRIQARLNAVTEGE